MSNLVATGLDHLCSTSGTQLYNDWGMTLYPNPSTGVFTMATYHQPESSYRLTVTSLLGQVVYITQINNPSTTLDLTGNPAGMYWVKIENEHATRIYKMMIE
jgi:hypothetical protein